MIFKYIFFDTGFTYTLCIIHIHIICLKLLSLVVNNYVYLQNIIQTFGVICSAHKRQFIDFLHEQSTRYSVVNNDEQTTLLLYDVYYLRVIYGRIIYRPPIVFRTERVRRVPNQHKGYDKMSPGVSPDTLFFPRPNYLVTSTEVFGRNKSATDARRNVVAAIWKMLYGRNCSRGLLVRSHKMQLRTLNLCRAIPDSGENVM